MTSSFYWTIISVGERQRLEKIFKVEREETNKIVGRLLDDYQPSLKYSYELRERLKRRSRGSIGTSKSTNRYHIQHTDP